MLPSDAQTSPGAESASGGGRHPSRTTWWVILLGLAVMAFGCWQPRLLVYLPGLAILALGIALAARGRVRGWVAFLLVVVLGTAIPWASAWYADSRDVAWSVDDAGATSAVDASGQTYLIGPDKLTVVDARTGAQRWRIALEDGEGPMIGADGTVLILDGEGIGSSVLRAHDAQGNVLWDRADRVDLPKGFPMAVTGTTIVVRDCADGTTARCDFAGIARDGTTTWTRAVTIPQTRARRFADQVFGQPRVMFDSRRVPAAVGVIEAHDRSDRLLVLDPDTGRVQQSATGPAKSFVAPYAIGDRLLVGRGLSQAAAGAPSPRTTCEWALYRGSRRVWSKQDRTPCSRGHPGRIDTAFEQRVYVATGSGYATIDLDTGASARVGLSLYDVYGAEVVVSDSSGNLVGSDPATGERLWTREVADDENGFRGDVKAGNVVVVTEWDTGTVNPFRDHGFRNTRRITVLDPRTGAELASTVDRSGAYGIGARRSGHGAFVLHKKYRDAGRALLLGRP